MNNGLLRLDVQVGFLALKVRLRRLVHLKQLSPPVRNARILCNRVLSMAIGHQVGHERAELFVTNGPVGSQQGTEPSYCS